MMKCHKKTAPLITADRILFGGIFLFILVMILGVNQISLINNISIFMILLFQGIIGFTLYYFSWCEAIKRIKLSKAGMLVSICPAFTILFAMMLLKEIPTIQQIGRFFIIIMGVFGLSFLKSE